MGELWQLGALEIAAAIRNRETTSRAVLDALVDRIDTVNGELNAIVALLGDEAVKAAEAADRAVLDGAPLGSLHGVPITVKENIDVAGWPTTQGVPALAEATPLVDAPIVERMRAAGAIPFARTNLPDFGLRVHTDSSLRGLTRNPWRPDVTAGGSSGGEASALASGMTPLGLGNDLGGSLRNPAHCCGIASIKPSTGVVPDASALPPEDAPIMFQLMAVQGVMARHVADVRAGLLAVAGPHPRDPLSLPVTLAGPDPDRPLSIAVLPEPPNGATDPGIADAIRRMADVLAAAGHDVGEAAPPSYARSLELWAELLLPDVRAVRPLFDELMSDDARAFLDFAHTEFPAIDTADWSMLFIERHAVARDWAAFFETWDVLLTPTWAQPPFAHGADVASLDAARATLELIRPVLPANLLGLPAAVVPAGVVDGLPVGAQFTGNRFADLTVLAAAQAVEDAIGPITPIEPVTAAGVTGRLVTLDLPGGPAFVAALRRVWDAGDAAFPVDQRLPPSAKAALIAAMAPSVAIDPSGAETMLEGGLSMEPGDALVVATSGAGGAPKGVVLTHDAVAASAAATNARLGVLPADHWLACLPLSHVGGLSVVTRALAGGTRLTVLPGFEAAAVAEAGASLVSLVATLLPRVEPSRFRSIVLGGSAPPRDLPPNVVTTYGMTETGSGVVYDGRPLDGVEVRIDRTGEIHVRGPMLLRAYRDGTDPRRDGWFATGDLGRWGLDGRLVVDGRRGDLIISGGENVWPEPVEAVLRRHPNVRDVAVRGTSHPEWGQVVTAYIVVAGEPPTLDELRAAVKEELAAHCAPRRLVLVDAIPRTALGKVRRAELR